MKIKPPQPASHNRESVDIVRTSGNGVGMKANTAGVEIGKIKRRIGYLENRVLRDQEELRELQKRLITLDVSNYTTPELTKQDLSDWSGLS